MTVSTTTNKTDPQIMGSSFDYDFTFRCLVENPTIENAKQAIKAVISDGTTETQLTYGTDYTVSLNADGSGGQITVVDKKTAAYTIIIYREYDLEQGSDYEDFNSFPAKTLEDNLDKLTMSQQQQQEQIDRCVKLDMTSEADPEVFVLEVERIYQSIDNVDTVADDIANVNAVSADLTNVDVVAGIATDVTTVAGIASDVTTVAGIASDVTTVAGIASDVTAVKSNATNINAVSADLTNVDVVAGIATDINTCSTNMTAIQEAPAAATAASTSATNAAKSATSAQQYAQDTKGFAPIGSFISISCTADYVPDGCLPCDGSEYSQSQFPALWTNYLASSPVKLQTCTYAEYASDITTYGQCGKFAIDNENEKFKVPTIKDGAFIQQAKSDSELGKSYNAGLPSIPQNGEHNHPLTQAHSDSGFGYPGGGNPGSSKIYTDNAGLHSHNGGVYGASNTVQPNAIALRFFVVVANAQINQSQMDWSALASSLAGKANTDMDNITATGKETFVGWVMPDLLRSFSANFKADFIHAKMTNSAYIGKSFIDMWTAGATSVFSNNTLVIEPCIIKLTVDGVDRLYNNTAAFDFVPASNLDTGSALQAGKNYYIYLVPNGTGCALKCSLNSTYPTGYTAANSRKIGWFHTLCVAAGTISGHLASGYVAADIIPNSVACLSFRPICDPSGMAYIDLIDAWVDIYLQSGTGANTASVYGATITDARYYGNHCRDMAKVGKKLPTDNEFSIAAFASNEKTNISDSDDPVTTGGHIDTESRRMISQYFLEDCCGALWQWLDSTGASGGSGWTTVNLDDNASGCFFGGGHVLLAGGFWVNGASCGSGARYCAASRSSLGGNFSARGLSRNLRLTGI